MSNNRSDRKSISFTINIDRDSDETITTITSSTSPQTLEIVGAADVGDLGLVLEAAVTIEEIILARTDPDEDQSGYSA